MNNYIFCPLCGEHKWRVDKTRSCALGLLTDHRCQDCSKFNYIEVMRKTESKSGLILYCNELYEENVDIEVYSLNIRHYENKTTIRDSWGSVVLELNRAVKFDWYKEKDIVTKVKKFLVFS